MNRFIRLLPLLGFFAITPVLADDPPATPPAASPAPPTKTVLEDKTLTNEEIAKLFAQGYKPTSRHGEVFYCRRELETGSHFAKMTCRTAVQMKQIARESKDMLAEKQLPSGNSPGR